MQVKYTDNGVYLENVENFDLAATLDCGQAFRWEPLADGSWQGIVGSKQLTLRRDNGGILLRGANDKDYLSLWKDYFDLDRDYGAVIKEISADERLAKAAAAGGGIRILRQQPWETLCSFIISQNNNIPRIKGIISRLCSLFGEKCGTGYTFPSAERIAACSETELAPLRAGFRAGYILDAARKVSSGEVDLDFLSLLPMDAARERLMTIRGVGPKVADCTLLFGLGFIQAFPQDVWIKRVMAESFDGHLPDCALPYAGIAQQYLFYSARENKGNIA